MTRPATWCFSAVLALAAMTSIGRADEASMTTADLDARVDQALFQTINKGVPVYNGGDPAGCYRIYQGSLTAIGPFLAHRPELQAAVQRALASAEATGSYEQKAFALRAILDDVRQKVTTRSLWARLGGEPAVKAVVHAFVAKAATDPNVNFTRGGKYPLDDAGVAHLEELLVQFVSSATGGPLKYTGRDMKSSHAGMEITEAQFGAIAADLIAVLKSFNVPQKEINELVGIVATTKKDIVEAPKPVDPRSLWARLGGELAVRGVVHAFVAKAATDPNVNFTRGGKYPLDAAGVAHLEELIVQFVSSATGGPLKYTGRDMKSSHAGMAITEAQFNAIAGDLIAVLKSFNVPQREITELVNIVATTKKDIVEAPASAAAPPKPVDPNSLWARLGGEQAVKAVVHDFVLKAAGDPKVDFTRGGKYALDAAGVAHLEELLVQFVSSATGGPFDYTGRDMKATHAGMAITDSQFNAIAGDLIAVLKSYKVPQKEIDELIGIVGTTRKDMVEVPK